MQTIVEFLTWLWVCVIRKTHYLSEYNEAIMKVWAAEWYLRCSWSKWASYKSRKEYLPWQREALDLLSLKGKELREEASKLFGRALW